MLFSVIVPVYNVEKYLDECVTNVLSQTFKDFELILVNDGSTDDSAKKCEMYAIKDDRIRVIHKKNGGLSDARNTGLDAATGSYIVFLDADDFWHTQTALEKIAGVISETSSKVIQFGHEEYWHTESQLIKGQPRGFSIHNGKPIDEMLIGLVATDGLAISACAMAIERRFLIDHHLYFVQGLKSEDLEWSIRLFLAKPSLFVMDDYFYAYRKHHGGSITANIDYHHLCDYCWILESCINITEGCNDKIQNSLMSYLMYQSLIAIALCYRVDLQKAQRKELLLRLEIVCKDRITVYRLNNKVKLAGLVYRICGFSVMAKILGVYLNNRGR